MAKNCSVVGTGPPLHMGFALAALLGGSTAAVRTAAGAVVAERIAAAGAWLARRPPIVTAD